MTFRDEMYTINIVNYTSKPIRTFGDNFTHARVKGHDCENGEYLNSK